VRDGRLTTSKVMTIVIGFHMSHYRDFKNYYLGHVSVAYKKEFPDLLSYTRFLAIIPRHKTFDGIVQCGKVMVAWFL
jgi:hypothetical protein